MEIIKQNTKAITKAVKVLKRGGLVIFPSETTYGIAADATNPKAVNKLINFKNRPFGKPFSVGVTDIKMAEKYIFLNKTARKLYKSFLPGPLTVVSTGKHVLAPGIEAENGTLGIRIPDYPFFLEVVRKFNKPITTTSANASYQKRPYKISDILNNISQKQKGLIDLIIDAGELPHNEPSTVIDTTLDDPVILRQGEIKLKGKNEVLSGSEEGTQNIAKELFQKYEKYLGKRPIIFALIGEMGTGKTQFTKGLGKVLAIKDEIVSPTFNLVLEYGKLTHIDAWRIQKPEELETLGFLKMIENKNMIIAIEWADRVMDEIKNQREHALIIWVKIKYGKKVNERLISWGVI